MSSGEKVRLGRLIKPAKVGRCGEQDYPILSITKDDGIVLQNEKFKKRIASKDTATYKVVPRGKLVQGIHIDEANFAIQNLVDHGIVSPAYKIWDIATNLVEPEYLALALRSKASLDFYRRNLVGTVHRRGRMSNDVFYQLEVNLPPLQEQRRILAILADVDKQIDFARQQSEMLDSLVKARFVEMFGDPCVNDKQLPIVKLSDLGTLERGKSKHRPRNDPRLLGGPYPLIQTGDIANAGLYLQTFKATYSEMGLQQSRMWPKGTLCITIAANIAKTAILEFDACFPDSVVGFTPNANVCNVFMHYWFEFFQAILESQAPQAAQKNINLEILSNLEVALPSVKLQREFSSFVAQVAKSRAIAQQQIEKLQLLYDSLAQEYFG